MSSPFSSITKFLALPFLLVTALAASADVKVAGIFTDNMVLQRDKPVPVWGWAEAGESVTVTFAGQKKSATAGPDGKWQIQLDALKTSSEGADLALAGAKANIALHNVVVGEVWLCGGQSNMGLSLTEVFNAPQEIAAANYPNLRLMAIPAAASTLPAENIGKGAWKPCTPDVAANFAGTAYFFGRALHRELNIPIGLIEFDRGSTGIECWVPHAAYQASSHPLLQELARKVSTWSPQNPIGRKAYEDTLKALAAWVPAARQALAEGKPVPPQPVLPAPDKHQANACETYNGTIHPLRQFAIRGAVWYQGESNPGEGLIYQLKLQALIAGWRTSLGQGDFPFYVVQLTNEGLANQDPAEDELFRYVPVREAQRRAAMATKNSGLVVAIDLGEDASGHPRNKRDVGERLALWARAREYGQKIECSGPLYKGFRVKGDAITLNFDHVGGGLMVGDKDGLDPAREIKDARLTNFTIAGADGKWVYADAQISGNTVVVRSDQVKKPVKVRYATSMNPKGPKLYNRDGLPATPFRTDEWNAGKF